MKPTNLASLLAAVCLLAAPVQAEVALNPIFSDSAVLQRDAEIPVWGKAAPGEAVTVEFAGQKKSATAGADGKWAIKLAPMPASAENRPLTATGDHSPAPAVAKNILVGEVWLCSGQSNMEYGLAKCVGGPEAIAASDNPLLRLCGVPHNVQTTPQDTVPVKWASASPAATKNFSAVPYWFGRHLQKELGVPVGIINSSYGGTPIQCWLPAETLAKGKWPQDKFTSFDLYKADYDKKVADTLPLKEKWEADKAAAKLAGQPEPPKPAEVPGEFRAPTTLWNGMVAPLLPLRVRGVAWYQGESNAYVGTPSEIYHDSLVALMSDWRAGFAQPYLPFIIFQISAFRKPQADPNEPTGIAVLREGQLKAVQETPHAALVTTIDLGGEDVHYLNKEPGADRAVKAALSLAYGRDLEASGPVFAGLEIKGAKAVLKFTHTAGGLVAKDGPLAGFVVAGADRKFVFADAKIEGDTVVVSSPQVPQPAAVRYGWADMPKTNFFNQAGLPAPSFRTDDWSATPAAK